MAGITSHPLYEVWRTIRKRCGQSPQGTNYKDYHNYGARGIRMCKEWDESYEAFYKWSMSHGYKPGLTIDRISNNRGYNPGNCKWVSRRTQANNRRTNTHVKIDGVEHTISQWARISKIDKDVIIDRLQRGWEPKKAVFTPVREYHFHSEQE